MNMAARQSLESHQGYLVKEHIQHFRDGDYGEADLDERINAGLPALREALETADRTHETIVYPGAQHAFHNDTGSRIHADAARDAWRRTLAQFAHHLLDSGV